jgi:hypothetical protein
MKPLQILLHVYHLSCAAVLGLIGFSSLTMLGG